MVGSQVDEYPNTVSPNAAGEAENTRNSRSCTCFQPRASTKMNQIEAFHGIRKTRFLVLENSSIIMVNLMEIIIQEAKIYNKDGNYKTEFIMQSQASPEPQRFFLQAHPQLESRLEVHFRDTPALGWGGIHRWRRSAGGRAGWWLRAGRGRRLGRRGRSGDLFNDLDYFLFTDQPRTARPVALVHEMESCGPRDLGIDVEVKCGLEAMPAPAESMMIYDLVAGHVVVYGDSDFLDGARLAGALADPAGRRRGSSGIAARGCTSHRARLRRENLTALRRAQSCQVQAGRW